MVGIIMRQLLSWRSPMRSCKQEGLVSVSVLLLLT